MRPETREEFEQSAREVKRYKPPSKHKIKYRRHVVQVENWIASKGLVQAEDVILYIMRAFEIERPAALKIFEDVKKDFERLGRVYG